MNNRPIQRKSVPVTNFFHLKEQWQQETAFLSSVTEIVMHPAYQQIIGMGALVIPYILQEMTKQPDHWFWALKILTGEDPVPPEQRGNVVEMTKTWLNWGKERGYIF